MLMVVFLTEIMELIVRAFLYQLRLLRVLLQEVKESRKVRCLSLARKFKMHIAIRSIIETFCYLSTLDDMNDKTVGTHNMRWNIGT